MVRYTHRVRRRPPWPEWAGLAAVAVTACCSWLLVGGAATGVYRHYAAQGDPPLLAIAVAGPDPAGEAAPGASTRASQLGHYGYFWNERAFHYRVALMHAVDDGPDRALLHRDTWQQHPDGVDAWREYTLLMEPVYGFLYRLAGDQSRPFVEFLLGLVPLVHVLLLLPVYAAARWLGGERPTAVAAAVVTATCSLGFARLAGSLLLKEDFALLLLLGFTALHLGAWRRQDRGLLAGAAFLLAAALASWHLAQFLAAVLLGAAAVAQAAGPTTEPAAAADPAMPRRLPPWAMPAAYLAAFLAAGLTPSLRERWFVFSAPTAVVAAWLLAALAAGRLAAARRQAAVRVAILVAAAAVGVAAALRNPVHGADYGHVTGLLLAKLTCGFVPPDDPARLAYAARQFWMPPFHTPGLAEIVAGLGFHAPLLALAVLWSAVTALRPGTPPPRRGFLLAVPVLAAGWLLTARLGVVMLPFTAVAAALMVQALAARAPGGPARAGRVAALVLGLAAAANLPTNLARPLAVARAVHAGRPAPVVTDDDARTELRTELLRWLTSGTPGPGSALSGAPAAVLADIGLSPQVLLYAQRPVVLNSQFENVAIRLRAERYQQALFADDPAVLWAFAREHDARCLVVDRNLALADGTGSARWLAAAPAPLSLRQTAVRLHLDPLGVPGFAPLWDNDAYRVFAVLEPGQQADPARWETGFSPWWQAANLTVRDGRLVDLERDRARLQAFEAAAARLQAEQEAVLAAAARRRPGWPPLLAMQRQLASMRLEAWLGGADQGPDDAAAAARLANAVQSLLADVDPATGLSVGRALDRLRGGGPDAAGWSGLLQAMEAAPTHHAVAAQLAAMAGHYDEAAAGFRRAAARWDDTGPSSGTAPELRRQLWDETVLWLAAAGRRDEACRLASGWLPHAGGGEGAGSLVCRLAAATDRPR